MESIRWVGFINPITGVVWEGEDGKENVRLVAGGHRLEAAKRLGFATIPCTMLECDDALRVELAEIDENFIRSDPSPAEHALLTGRRREIIRALADQQGTLSQDETASRQAKRRAGQKTGPDAASVRDQANKTGEGKDKVHRSTKRFDTLGPAILKSVVGTSLDNGAQLDALTKLPKEVCEDLANRAAAGATVSARRTVHDEKPDAIEEPQQSPLSDLEQAYDELFGWINKYEELLRSAGLWKQLIEFNHALYFAIWPSEETDPSERTSEPASKRKWSIWPKDRKRD